MNQLCSVYGKLSPIEQMNMENQWNKAWDPQAPIEAHFKQLEDIFEQALAYLSAYTKAQMIGKTMISIEQSGLMPMALLEWNGFVPPNVDWTNLKAHFGEAYQLLITTEPLGRTIVPEVTTNTQELADQGGDYNDLTIITNTLGKATMASNAAGQVMREEMTALNREMVAMQAAVAANAQGSITAGTATTTVPSGAAPQPATAGVKMPPAATCPTPPTPMIPPTPPMYQPPPPPPQAAYAAVPPAPPVPPAAPLVPLVTFAAGPPPPHTAYRIIPASVPMAGPSPPPQGYGQYQQTQGREKEKGEAGTVTANAAAEVIATGWRMHTNHQDKNKIKGEFRG